MRWLLLAFSLAACGPKPVEPALPGGAVGVVLVTLSPLETGGWVEAPPALANAVVESLVAEGLLLRPVSLESRMEGLAASRNDTQRLAAVAGSGGWVVMVETRARFFSPLEGRWRWVVEVRAGLGRTDALERAVYDTFEVPVFLRHEHQGPEDAIEAAAPVIGAKVARLLRQQLGAEPARW